MPVSSLNVARGLMSSRCGGTFRPNCSDFSDRPVAVCLKGALHEGDVHAVRISARGVSAEQTRNGFLDREDVAGPRGTS